MCVVEAVDDFGFEGLAGVQDQLHDTPAADNVCVLSVVNNFGQD